MASRPHDEPPDGARSCAGRREAGARGGATRRARPATRRLRAVDRGPVAERRGLVAELNAIVWDSRRGGRERLRAFCKRLVQSARAKAMLLDSVSRVLYPKRSSERTTSPAER